MKQPVDRRLDGIPSFCLSPRKSRSTLQVPSCYLPNGYPEWTREDWRPRPRLAPCPPDSLCRFPRPAKCLVTRCCVDRAASSSSGAVRVAMGLFPMRFVLVGLLMGAWAFDAYQDCVKMMQSLALQSACVASSDDPDGLRGAVAPVHWDYVAQSLIPWPFRQPITSRRRSGLRCLLKPIPCTPNFPSMLMRACCLSSLPSPSPGRSKIQ